MTTKRPSIHLCSRRAFVSLVMRAFFVIFVLSLLTREPPLSLDSPVSHSPHVKAFIPKMSANFVLCSVLGFDDLVAEQKTKEPTARRRNERHALGQRGKCGMIKRSKFPPFPFPPSRSWCCLWTRSCLNARPSPSISPLQVRLFVACLSYPRQVAECARQGR